MYYICFNFNKLKHEKIEIMKVSELIEKLEKLKLERGDKDIIINVGDSFSVDGNDTNPSFAVSGDWYSGTATNETEIRLFYNIKNDYDDKRAKITFRK